MISSESHSLRWWFCRQATRSPWLMSTCIASLICFAGVLFFSQEKKWKIKLTCTNKKKSIHCLLISHYLVFFRKQGPEHKDNFWLLLVILLVVGKFLKLFFFCVITSWLFHKQIQLLVLPIALVHSYCRQPYLVEKFGVVVSAK